MSGNEDRDVNQTIAGMLNSSFGGDHYGAGKVRKSKSVEDRAKRTRRRAARKGGWNEAYRLHARLLFRLGKYGQTDIETALLRQLRSCKPSHRCASAACPKCTYAVQGVMVELVRDLFSYGVRLEACLTVVPLLQILHDEDVNGYIGVGRRKFQSFREQLDKTCNRAGITVIGCLDVDTSEFSGDEFKEHSKPHLHGITFKTQIEAAQKVLRRDFNNGGSVNRAVFVSDYDGSDKWVRYAFKYPNSRKIRKMDEHGRWLEPAYKAPTVQQQLRQALLLDELGWRGRLFFKGVKLSHGPRGWQLVLTDVMPEVWRKG